MKELIEKLLIKHEAKLISESTIKSHTGKLSYRNRKMLVLNGIDFILTEETPSGGNGLSRFSMELYSDSVIDALGNGELNFDLTHLDKCLEILDICQLPFGIQGDYRGLAILGKFKDSFFESEGLNDMVSIACICTPDSHVIELMREAGLLNEIPCLETLTLDIAIEVDNWREKYPEYSLLIIDNLRELYKKATNYAE